MKLDSMSDVEILGIANPIMDNLMEASTAIDHERHIRDFSKRMKGIVTKEYLQKVCEKYQREKGYFSRREPVAVFRRPGAAAIVWKQWFTKRRTTFGVEIGSIAPVASSLTRCWFEIERRSDRPLGNLSNGLWTKNPNQRDPVFWLGRLQDVDIDTVFEQFLSVSIDEVVTQTKKPTINMGLPWSRVV